MNPRMKTVIFAIQAVVVIGSAFAVPKGGDRPRETIVK